MKKTSRLRSLLRESNILVVPGAADALTGRLIQEAGFDAVYATGAGIANAQFALPDIGLLSLTEMVTHIRRLVEAVDMPVIADADTGYGNSLNVMRTVREYEHAGVAAIQIEDQVSPKKCGHFAGKEVIATEEMVQKLRAAIAARSDPDLVLIARTDALATQGFDAVVKRARLYAENGADVIFVEAPTERDQVVRLPKEINAPLLFNLTEGARSPLFSTQELQAFGYKIVIYPNMLLRVTMRATQESLAVLKAEGSSVSILPRMVDWQERQRVVRLHEFEELDRTFVKP
ncbi:MAG: isocitrate lyase/phosphoenolpyruvate mutase family protein [Chloroflexi bacterium]|nr:isocitrate lyase/phosphoenolpyruvate mutase family protein [Chloroflexota bacterium]